MAFTFDKYSNTNGGSMEVAEVPEDGTVVTYGYQNMPVKKGDMIAKTERPDEYVLVNQDDLSEFWSKDDGTEKADAEPVETVEYDPSTDSVAGAKSKLETARTSGDRDEFDRILSAEKDGKNRAGIVSQEF